jgi:hypothetical protein
MPVDGVVYMTSLTLVLFLLFRIPGMRKLALFQEDASAGSTAAGGLTSIVTAGLVLSVQFWAGPSHLFNGVNYANSFQAPMAWIGSGLLLFGIGLIAGANFSQIKPEVLEELS